MKVGISAWRLHGQRLGIGRYIEYLLKGWNAVLEPGDHVTIFGHEPLRAGYLDLSAQFTRTLIHPRLTNALWENMLLPLHARGLDVMFCPSYTVPLTYRGRIVLVIHSLDEAVPGAQPWWYPYTWGAKYRASARRADRVIAGDGTTRDRVVEWYGVAPDRIDIVNLGVDEAFAPDRDPARLRATRIRCVGADRPYVLFAGGLSHRRNVPVLMAAFSAVVKRLGLPHSLLLLGPNRANVPIADLARQLDIADRVVHTDGVFADHRDIVPVYNAADLYVMPSSTDGFSLTLVEAMACGTPAITVNSAGPGEIAHGHALTIEAPTVPLLTDAMARVLGDPVFARALGAQEIIRAKQYSWRTTAQRTLDIVRRVAQA